MQFGCRAQILSRKVSPRAFKEQPGKKGQEAGEVGIEGTTIEHPDEVILKHDLIYKELLLSIESAHSYSRLSIIGTVSVPNKTSHLERILAYQSLSYSESPLW